MGPLPPRTVRGSLEGGGIRYLSRSTFGSIIHGGGGFVKLCFCRFFSLYKEEKAAEKEKLKKNNGKYSVSHTSHLRFFWVPFLYKEKAQMLSILPLLVQLALPLEFIPSAPDAAVAIGQEPGAQKVDDAQA